MKKPLFSADLSRFVLYTLALFVVFFSIAGWHFQINKQKLKSTTLEHYLAEQQRAWQAVLHTYNNGMEAYFYSYVTQQVVLDLLHRTQKEDEQDRDQARVLLYRKLADVYDLLKTRGVRQFQFFTTDSRALLRFHHPHRFGDPLAELRPGVAQVNRTGTRVSGFESGRVVSGFRNIFPIFDGSTHLGAVELSQPFEALRIGMAHLFSDKNTEFLLLINKAGGDELFSEQQRLYAVSSIDPDWLIEDPHRELYDSGPPLSPTATRISAELNKNPAFGRALNSGTATAVAVRSACCYMVVTQIPVIDISGRLGAALITFQPSAALEQIHNHYIAQLWVIGGATLLLAMAIALTINRTHKVREQRRRIMAITDAVHSGVYVINSEGQIVFSNQRASDILGYSTEELSNRDAHSLFHVHAAATVECPIFQVIEHGSTYRNEETFCHKNGTHISVDVASSPVLLGAGDTGAVVAFDDISERKKAADQLRKLSQAVEQSPVVVVITDTRGRIEYVNPCFCDTTGYTAEEAIGRNPRILKAEQSSVTNYHQLWATLTAGESWQGEFLNKRKDDTNYWERALISPIRDEQGKVTHYLAIKEDITEQKQLEAQLLQAQKMESVGTLAGGIAHDFNNILSAITGFTWMTLKKIEEGSPLRRNLEQVLAAADRAASLTKDLLLFSRKQPKQTSLFDFNELLTRTESLWRRTLDVDIRLAVNPAIQPLSVVGDFHQLQQVLMNLVINARDAITGTGEINLTTEQISLDPSDSLLPDHCHPGEYARLKVHDNGVGMEQETLKHIFEPFYTTKSVDKGTGLGLAVVYGIVQQHKGFIHVDSQPGKGTCFCVYLPLSADVCLLDQPAIEEAPPPGGNETILLAEDDSQGRRALTEILLEAGYRVITAVNGEDAVQHFIKDPDSIDLLLFDLIMPQLSGKGAAEAINNIRPGTRTLFISGYAPDTLALATTDHVLSKPVNPRELLFKVRELLDR